MPTVLAESDAELRNAAEDARGCQRCPLYKLGTQTVFGTGPADARVMLVGEQPGDVEDRRGLPFVGPAGRLLDQAIEAAGLNRDRMYVTNAVKHFKYVARGKRRLHQKPNVYEIDRCKWWLDLELEMIAPKLTVALGVTDCALADRTTGQDRTDAQPYPGDIRRSAAFGDRASFRDPALA